MSAYQVVFTGGGSAGHVFPALAVAEYLKKKESIAVQWIGSMRGIERSLVTDAGIRYHAIPSGKLRRYLSWKNIRDIFLIKAGIIAALVLLIKLRPQVVFSKGGYVSVPVVLAAAFLRIAVISHESDLVPGLATRINIRFSRILLLSFAESSKYIARKRAKYDVTGNPLRSLITCADGVRGRNIIGARAHTKILLFLGGSLGAAQINTLVWQVIPHIPRGCTIVHQSGVVGSKPDFPTEVQEYIQSAQIHYVHQDFFGKEIAHIMAAADVVVSRAGANTLWELAYLAKPMILIPLSRASSRGDQIDNAAYFVRHAAALSLENPVAESLVRTIRTLLSNNQHAATMGANSRNMIHSDATQLVAHHIFSILQEHRH